LFDQQHRQPAIDRLDQLIVYGYVVAEATVQVLSSAATISLTRTL